MKTVAQMRESIAELMKALGDIKAACVSENRDYTEEEKKEIRRYQARIKGFQENIALEEENQRLSDELKTSQELPVKPDPNPSEQRGRPAGTFQSNEDDPDRFRSLGEQLMCVRAAMTPHIHYFDERLRWAGKTDFRATGMSEGIASDGGFLLQDNFANTLIENIWDDPDLLGKVNKITITKGNNMKIPRVNETSRADGSRAGGIQMYWKAEGAAKTASQPDLEQIELELKKLIGLCYVTDELLEDAPALETYIRRMFTQEMRFKIIDALINGTGAGQPQGILVSPCLVTVAKETGQANTTIVYENIVNMYSRMLASSRKNAVWHVNQDCEPQLFTMGITVGVGGSPVYQPPGGASASPYSTFFGRPIIPLEQCQTLGTKGDMIFCDWSKYVAIDKGGLQTATSIHVQFVYDESVFRFVYRFDGQTELKSAITPFSGSGNTLSHFITLAGRP